MQIGLILGDIILVKNIRQCCGYGARGVKEREVSSCLLSNRTVQALNINNDDNIYDQELIVC